jgi:hypothetical protein
LRRRIDTGKHLMRNCGEIFGSSERFLHTERAVRDSVQIPVYPEFSAEDLEYMAGAINKAWALEKAQVERQS